MFIASTLARWEMRALEDDAALVVSELVTNAVKVTGAASAGTISGMLKIGTTVLGTADVHRAAEFWMAALGYVPRDGEIGAADDWAVLVPPGDGPGGQGRPGGLRAPGLAIGLSESPVQEHPRVHLDLYAADSADQAAEVERLLSLGAELVDWDLYPPDPDFRVLADTEGNRFCVIDTGPPEPHSEQGDPG